MRFKRLLTMVSFAAVCALTSSAQTATTSTRTTNFPPFGLGATETARVNLTNTAVASSSGTAASCVGTVTFVNAAGTAIGTATSFTIASGVTFSASLPFASAGLSGNRGQIRAVVAVTRSTTTPTPCSLLMSLETFETSSGATHIYTTAQGEFGGGPDGHRR